MKKCSDIKDDGMDEDKIFFKYSSLKYCFTYTV